MQKTARIITQSYHYISEGIILFLIVLLVLPFSEVVYWLYLLILLFSSFALSILAYYERSGIYYFILIPILGTLFYSVGYTISVTAIFSLILPYRYFRINKTEIKRKEAVYLGTSAFLVVVLMFVIGDYEIIWLFIIQFLLTFIGYYYTNLSMVSRGEGIGYSQRFWLMLSGMLLAAGVAYFFLSEVVGRLIALIWQGIGIITVYLSSLFAGLFSWIQPDPFIIEPQPDLGVTDSPVPESELGNSLTEGVQSYAVIFIGIAFAIIVIIAVILFRKLRGEPRDEEETLEEQEYNRTVEKVNTKTGYYQSSSWRDLFRKPEHPVRKLVYQFEKRLAKTDEARMSHETIEKWLGRIGHGTELETYQRVRYGNQEVSDDDLAQLKQELRKLENDLL